MNPGVYQFAVEQQVPLDEAERSFHLALVAAEGLFGQALVQMDAAYHVDEVHRLIMADATSEVGRAVVSIFAGFMLRQFGADAFVVRRMTGAANSLVPA